MKEKRVICLTEKDEKELSNDLKVVDKLINSFRPAYTKFFEDLNSDRHNPQRRAIATEVLLTSMVHDSQLPSFVVLGMLDKIKSDILNINFTKPIRAPSGELKSYIG